MKTNKKYLLPASVEQKIYLFRGHKVMLDKDLAELYGVRAKILNQTVRRNKERFPSDFMFELNEEEIAYLRQAETSRGGRGQHRKYTPYAFTEQGVAMLSSVLKSRRAIQVNIEIMRTFVRLRNFLNTNRELSKKFEQLEKTVATHDKAICSLFDAIRKLMDPQPSKAKQIGFNLGKNKS